MRTTLCAVTLALLLAAAPATAKDSMRIEGDRDFAAQQQQILADLSEGKRYAKLKPEDLQTVRSALARMDKVLGASVDVQGLNEHTKVALFNDQELVNTILTNAGEDSHLVCERTRTIGSNRMASTCKTVGERRGDTEASQDTLRYLPVYRPPAQ